MLYRVVLAFEDAQLGRRIRASLTDPGIVVRRVVASRHVWRRVVRSVADLVIVERALIPSPVTDSVGLLQRTRDAPDLLVLADDIGPGDQAQLAAAGATAVLPAGIDAGTLQRLVRARREERERDVAQRLRRPLDIGEPRLSDFVSASPAMQSFLDVVERTLDSEATLLITGETGVGKERLARAIHAETRRASGPFVAVNCAALPESLLESELFGHTEGAFTGATQSRRGWFELAHGGTLFLDEIGELPLRLQPKLLRAVQGNEFQPLGSERTLAVDVRIMAASNRDLAADVQEKTFRRDLFYRLSVVTLAVPPLRERREDIPELVESYADHFAAALGRTIEVSEAALMAMTEYPWPGNIRELRNVIERAVLLAENARITPEELPEAISRSRMAGVGLAGRAASAAAPPDWLERSWRDVRAEALARIERAYFAGLLEATDGRVGETARRAGIEPRSLYDKMRRLGLRKEDFRTSGAGR